MFGLLSDILRIANVKLGSNLLSAHKEEAAEILYELEKVCQSRTNIAILLALESFCMAIVLDMAEKEIFPKHVNSTIKNAIKAVRDAHVRKN